MCGVSGSGKTCTAARLARCGYTLLSVDEIAWKNMNGSPALLSPDERQRAYADATSEVAEKLREVLVGGGKAVVDATFCKRARRDEFRSLCRDAGAEPLILFLHAPLALLRQRLSQRKGSGPNDQIVPPRLLERYFSNFETPREDENFVTLEQYS